MSYNAPQGFWKNEKYTTIDLKKNLQLLQKRQIKFFGLYGQEDGLYSALQVSDLQNLVGAHNVKYFEDCSHNVFIDQQTQFIDTIKKWTK
jgi:proline iminopeptidase